MILHEFRFSFAKQAKRFRFQRCLTGKNDQIENIEQIILCFVSMSELSRTFLVLRFVGFSPENDVTPLKRTPTEHDLIGRYQLSDVVKGKSY